MNLVKTRYEMLEVFRKGHKPHDVLEDYREYRNSEDWRVSESVEELCEYILYLESKINETT